MKVVVILETARAVSSKPLVYILPDQAEVSALTEAFKRQKLDKIYTVHVLEADAIDVAATPGLLAKDLRRAEDDVRRDSARIARMRKKLAEKQNKQNKKGKQDA